jgi:hypothetical protein
MLLVFDRTCARVRAQDADILPGGSEGMASYTICERAKAAGPLALGVVPRSPPSVLQNKDRPLS